VTRAVLVIALIALALPAGAAAHATLTGTSPENGAVLDAAPAAVVVTFDDTVRVASGNAAVANATNESVLGGPATAHAHVLRIPLRHNLANGAYSVRWSIVSDDGHRERGVLAFAVGAGSASPRSVLGAGTTLTWNDILLRTLYYLGLLAAGGAAVFGLRTRTLFGEALRPALAHLLFFSLLLVFLGGSGILHSAPPGTRFALVVKIAITVALAGAAAAALAPAVPRLLPIAVAASLLLLAAPTLSGHALDRNQPRVLAAVIDLAHISAAAVWFGGLLALVYVVPRASVDDGTRRAGARAFSASALIAVLVLAASGLGRALTELSAVSQVWSTSYGRALIVKTALFLPLLGVGWLNRTLLLDAFARLRRSVLVEITVITGIVVAVAVLTELRPGQDAPKALAASLAAPQPPPVPPRAAVVDARELAALAVGVAREPGRATVTLLGPDNTGVSRDVTIDGARAAGCGSGCYRANANSGPLRVTVDGRPLVFTIPENAPDGSATLAALTKNFRSARTIVFRESLASSPTGRQLTHFTVVAPHRLAYAIVNGPAAVVIGAKRWDKDSAKGQWILSQQTPLDVTQPYWRAPTNVHTVSPGVITFFDPHLPAWFRVDYSGRHPTVTRMTAAAHFMVDRYTGFDVPAAVSPPR
jgi:copper transport protein